MKHYKLTAAQIAANGGNYTDLFVIRADDDFATETVADNTDLDIVLDALAAGDIVYPDRLLIEVKEAFGTTAIGTGDPSADYSMGCSVGVASAETAFYNGSSATTTLYNSGTPAAAKTTIVGAAATEPYQATTAINMEIRMEVADADGGIDELNYGELWVWMNISRASSRQSIQV